MSKFDSATDALIEKILEQHRENPNAKLLWLADEHPISPAKLDILPKSSLVFISNRFDQYQLATSKGIRSQFSDFEILPDAAPESIFFRAPKERALTHFLINQSYAHLPHEGKLWIFGYKNEGIKTHISRAAKLFGSGAKVIKGSNQLSIACLNKLSEKGELLDDANYQSLRQITIEQFGSFWSKPGIYGWAKIDAGSELLTKALSKHGDTREGMQILDIGCGYGYLGLWATRLKPSLLTVTDNCFGALEAARKNLASAGAQIQPSNAGDGIEGQYDLILCNPPFHQGFSTTPNLHAHFLSNVHRLLNPKGAAWFVVNQFLPLEKIAQDNGLKATEILRKGGFKVLRLNHRQVR
ncbi:MAG: methyltransferase [Pseudomonadales bacterium]